MFVMWLHITVKIMPKVFSCFKRFVSIDTYDLIGNNFLYYVLSRALSINCITETWLDVCFAEMNKICCASM